MREWWANVWANGGGYDDLGYERPSREECSQYDRARPDYRIHVRLKPEGAPNRYASEAERERWEHHAGCEWTDVQIRQLREMSRQEKAVADYWNRISPIS